MSQAALAADPNNMAAPSSLPPAASSHDPAPTVPSPMVGRHMHVVKQAGRGGPTAYAREGVLELGGGMSLSSTSDYLQLTMTPAVGYFITNNFELSFIPSWSFARVGKKGQRSSPTTLSFLVQSSLHLPLADTLFVYGGLGIGAAFLKTIPGHAGDHGWGFAFQPELGLNMMVGRSGIVSPYANVMLATNKVIKAESGATHVALNTLVGAGVRYSVMW